MASVDLKAIDVELETADEYMRGLVVDTGVRILDVDEGKNPESPTGKNFKADKFPLSRWESAMALGVFLLFSIGLMCIYLTMPAAEYEMLKLPRTIADLRLLKDHLANYAGEYPAKFILVYCSTYIFMQTFMIPGTIFMSLLAGALFGVIRGLFLVVFNATAGASSCYFLSKLIGRPIINWLWPDKLRYFQAEVAKRKDKLLNYMLFLRVTPTLPNLFINLASPIVDIPFHVFFLATVIGWTRARRSQISERSIRCQDPVRSFLYWVDFVTSCCIEEKTGIRIEVFSSFSMEKWKSEIWIPWFSPLLGIHENL